MLSHYRPVQTLRTPRYLANWHMKVVRLSAPRTGRLYSPPQEDKAYKPMVNPLNTELNPICQ